LTSSFPSLRMAHKPNTLLINPTITSRSSARFPLSLLQLAAALDRTGNSQIVDGNVDRDIVGETLQALAKGNIDVVGISVMGGPQIAPAIAVSKAVREYFPEKPIVWGGYFPTLYTDTALVAPYVDYAIRGQGEESFPELVAAH
jgi:anaerobic magnesium-protoporphyrin IX monomethyl ester cyclase